MISLVCRACGAPLTERFADLGMSPISNAFPRDRQPREPENVYPLCAYVCSACKLVQLEDVATREAHFHEDYAYYSSFSPAWLAHAKTYAEEAVTRFSLGPDSKVVEIGSNDGYLLRNFVDRGISCLGIDPSENVATVARCQGIETIVGFFGPELAEQLKGKGDLADLMIANNVLAHVPDLNEFVDGFARLLKPGGTVNFEFPHLLELIRNVEFDTIYHEHYCYFSLLALEPLFARHGLVIYDVQKLKTHGGSLRLFVSHATAGFARSDSLAAAAEEERAAGLGDLEVYRRFGRQVKEAGAALTSFLKDIKASGALLAGYGAPAKATTLLNFCGIDEDIMEFTVDRNPAKQGRLIPGTGIRILPPDQIDMRKPDFVVILAWNLEREVRAQLCGIGEWGGRFILPIPTPSIIEVEVK